MSDNTGILEELLSENIALRQRLKDFTSSKSEDKVVESLSSFTIEELEGKLKLIRILLAQGLWNGVKYTKEELKKMYDKFKNKLSSLKIKVEHERDKNYKNRVVGKNTKVEWDDMLGAIKAETDITDQEAIRDIKEGKFKATSLKTKMKKVTESTGMVKGIDLEPVDDSLTEYPACKVASIFAIQELSEGNNKIEYFGIQDYKEKDLNKDELIIIEGDIMTDKGEFEELSETYVTVLPEEDFEDEEVELEFMPMSEYRVLKKKRVIYEYYPPGKYPKTKRTAKRKQGYYYYPYGKKYPVPSYYWYPYYYGYKSEEDDTELSLEEGELLYETLGLPKSPEKGQKAILKVRGMYTVFEATGKKGFGMWKIKGRFKTEKEARDFIAGKGKKEEEEKQEKDEHGCIVGKEKWDEKEKKCIPISEEEQSAWTDCIGKERKAGKSFKEAVAICKKKLKKEEEKEEKDEHGCIVGKEEWDEEKEKCVSCPGSKIKSKGKGRGKGYGEGEGPKGIPIGEKLNKDDIELVKEVKDMSEELRRKRCEFCGELVEDLTKHYEECKVYQETVESLAVVKCKFCGKEFKADTKEEAMKLLKEHLPKCEKYGKYKKAGKEEKLSENKPEEKGKDKDKLGEEKSTEEKPTVEKPTEVPKEEETVFDRQGFLDRITPEKVAELLLMREPRARGETG